MDSGRKKFDDTANEHNRFCKRVGRVWLYHILSFLDLEPDALSGHFEPRKVQTLIDFCAENPEYHILSCNDHKIYNKYIANANFYYLADGDQEPDLLFDFEARLSIEDFLQVGHVMFAAVIGNVKNRRKT